MSKCFVNFSLINMERTASVYRSGCSAFPVSSGGGDTARTGRISEKSELTFLYLHVFGTQTGTVLLYNGT